ncbi:hypothetical protein [Methylobacterium indicum]|uniref:Pectate lyase domain-containing protein n=3 Tax=Methylobacterium indicum TaxID=1775910 RepID=A0A8H8WSK1_9HYPH|nr:hypothetical protein [Methylobacterium indicum]BCM83621.1 hypothetical protein mvi_20820 [Methylobacterium indicum]
MAQNLAHGFAAMNGGTSGGSGGPTVHVSTGAELQKAIDGVSATSGPLTIVVDGKITPANSGVDAISIAGRNNISVIGGGSGAEFDGIGIRISGGSSNLIIQNLKIHNVATGPKDAIGIEGPSRNIMIDHNELYSSMAVDKDYYDGLLDIKRGAEYITVSNNYIHDHHKASLVGYADEDTGARFVTYDHNVFENLGSRTPSVRDGHVHIYDNYFKDISASAINLRMGAVGLIENNVFENVRDPIVSLDSTAPGYWDLRGNVMSGVTWSQTGAGEASAQDGRSTASYSVPYAYGLDAAAAVKGEALAQAGVGRLDGAAPATGAPAPVPAPAPEPSPAVTPAPTPSEPAPIPVPPAPEPAPAPTAGRPGDGGDLLTGTDGDDTLDGGAGRDVIHGAAGADTILGGAGRDTLFGEGGNDVLSGGAGNDSLDGGAGDDSLSGGTGSDTLVGGIGNDTLEGGASADTLIGGDGDDWLDGGSNADAMSGGAGNDTYVVDIARDTIVELTGEGIDTVRASTSYSLGANLENLVLTGAGKLNGTGNELANLLVGNDGDNRLDGGAGDDTLVGGAGKDTFAFTAGQGGHDRIDDFRFGEDMLLLKGYAPAQVILTDGAAGTTLHMQNETVDLLGVHLDALGKDWIKFA